MIQSNKIHDILLLFYVHKSAQTYLQFHKSENLNKSALQRENNFIKGSLRNLRKENKPSGFSFPAIMRCSLIPTQSVPVEMKTIESFGLYVFRRSNCHVFAKSINPTRILCYKGVYNDLVVGSFWFWNGISRALSADTCQRST